jgi:hypothetical protein
MSVLRALADGCQRALRAPALTAGLWLTYVVAPIPVGRGMTDAFLGLIETSAIDPMPALLMVLRRPEMWWHAAIVTFLLGGLMDRLARDRATATFGFFGAAGMFFFRFLRLNLIAAPIYWVLLRGLYPALPSGQAGSYLLVGLLLVATNVIIDFAKVRMVVEDRRSAIGALAAGFRFVRRHAAATLLLSVINMALAGFTWWLAAAFDIGMTTAVYAYLLARALLRLIYIASAVSLFQGRLAHARYTGRALPTWPDSPAAEAVLPR